MNTLHIDELAELYALGALNEAERESVDAHAMTCEACAARLGEAEAAVASLIEPRAPSKALDRRIHASFVVRETNWRRVFLAAAAAFVLGLLPALGVWLTHAPGGGFERDREAATVALVSSHFTHAPFAPLVPGAPKAKIIYARTQPWIYVVAETNRSLEVRALTDGSSVSLGTLRVQGNTGELYLPHPPPASRYELLDGGRVVGTATITRPYRP
jgi:hypothetical protein